jgi:DUF1680 family protein
VLWLSVVDRRMYLTGGLGARSNGEAFGNDYQLPNLTAYNETCAAVSNVFWQERMFLLNKDAKYIDILERTLYNQVLAGVSLSGDRFFYTNVLESDGSRNRSQRQPWFTWPCCPTNIVRILPSVPGYAYATDDSSIYVNLFISSDATLKPGKSTIKISQQTTYPREGSVKLTVTPEQPAKDLSLKIRVPGWAQGHPVPGDLYTYADKETSLLSFTLNGQPINPPIEKGYATITRNWNPNDTVTFSMTMPIHRVLANSKVEADQGRAAIERGPLVYCAEAVDNYGKARGIVLPLDSKLIAEQSDLLGGITIIKSQAAPFVAVPYNVWANRTPGEMTIWIPTSADTPASTLPAGRAGR